VIGPLPAGPVPELARLVLADCTDAIAEMMAVRPTELRSTAERGRGLAGAIRASGTQADGASWELARGWSAVPPRLATARLVATCDRVADLLTGHAQAAEVACQVIEQTQQALAAETQTAVAQLSRVLQAAPAGVPALLGLAGNAGTIMGLVVGLGQRVRAHRVAIDSALLSLAGSLTSDPAAEADLLRSGPTAVLPPDPVQNPASRTDLRNRALLEADKHSGDLNRLVLASGVQQSLDLARSRSGVAQLLVYDRAAYHGQGRAAIAVGDLTTADNIAVVVPGIGSSPTDMSGGVNSAADLRDEAQKQAPGSRSAVVAWYGYDIPMSTGADILPGTWTSINDALAALSADNAVEGGAALSSDVQTFEAMAQSSRRTTLLGFSMGSTTVSEAARFDVPVDGVVLMGSPGAGLDARTVKDYRAVRPENVYAVKYAFDPVTLPETDLIAKMMTGSTKGFGPDPADPAFGAKEMAVSSNEPTNARSLVTTGKSMLDQHSMTNYMSGAALAAEAAVVNGATKRVPVKKK